jgi:hypothetical protein
MGRKASQFMNNMIQSWKKSNGGSLKKWHSDGSKGSFSLSEKLIWIRIANWFNISCRKTTRARGRIHFMRSKKKIKDC